jgi:acetolactate synthase-1/3 small subunit
MTTPEIITTDNPPKNTQTSLPASVVLPEQPLHTLSVLVNNKPGVLARIAQVFARRGFNIESLVVSPTMDGRFSRMTIGTRGDPTWFTQIISQANKLIDVIHCTDHTHEDAVVKELALIKIHAPPAQRGQILQIVEHFKSKTVDLAEESLVVQATGDSDKLDAMIGMLRKFGILELVRTGKVVMSRGSRAT